MSTQLITLDQVHKLQNEAIQTADVDKMMEAKRLLEHICAQNPDDWVPLFYLANCYLWLQRYGIAIPMLWRCRELSEVKGHKQHEIYNNLGTCYRGEHKVEKAKEALEKSLEIKPDDADTLNNLGTLNINEGTPHDGIKYLRRALEVKPDHYQAHWNLGLCLLETEQWEEGFKEYAWGLITKDRMNKNYGNALWWNDGIAHPDKNIVVYGEQGIGDEILFASMVQELKYYFNEVIFDCHPRLLGMFKRSFPEVICYPTRKIMDEELPWVKDHKIHYKVSSGNLGAFLRKQEKDFPRRPWLIPSRELVQQYKAEIAEKAGDGPYVAISWIGGHKKTRKDVRCVELDKFKKLYESGVKVISAQYTEHHEDVEQFCKETGHIIYQFPEVFCSTISERYYIIMEDGSKYAINGKEACFSDKYDAKNAAKKIEGVKKGSEGILLDHGKAYDWDHTFAFIQAMYEMGGMVLTVNNSLEHLCAAGGIRCHTLTPDKPDWRHGLTRTDSIFARPLDVIQYRQARGEKWDSAVNRAIEDALIFLGVK